MKISEHPGMKPPKEDHKHLYHALLRIRRTEERIVELYAEQEMRCPTHFSIGQEAAAVGVCAHLGPRDYVMSAHRSHAHYLAKGGDLKRMLAELYGKATGCARGKGGSMHLVDLAVGFLGCVPIVGSTIPIGVGAGFGSRQQGLDNVCVVFFGDGAVETGVFYESVNFALLRKLPILFVCENNLYSVNTPLAARQPAGREIWQLAQSLGLPAGQSDGQVLGEVFALAGRMLADVRTGGGPALIELRTYRWLEHCGPNSDLDLGFRPEGEFEFWKKRCPVELYRARLLEGGFLNAEEFDSLESEVRIEIDEAFEFARSSPFPERDELFRHVHPEG